MGSLAADIAASDVTEDASSSLLGYPPSRFAAAEYKDECTTTAGFTEEGDQLLLLASQQYENEAIAASHQRSPLLLDPFGKWG